MILRWNEATDASNLTKDQLQRMKTQRQKTIRNLSLNPTVESITLGTRSNLTSGRIELLTFVSGQPKLLFKRMMTLPL